MDGVQCETRTADSHCPNMSNFNCKNIWLIFRTTPSPLALISPPHLYQVSSSQPAQIKPHSSSSPPADLAEFNLNGRTPCILLYMLQAFTFPNEPKCRASLACHSLLIFPPLLAKCHKFRKTTSIPHNPPINQPSETLTVM